MNILVVEPSKLYQQAFRKLFAPYATHLFITDSGDEALQIYCTASIDLICSAFYLIDMDGMTFVSNIRKLKWGKTVPVLLVTSKDDPAATIQIMHDGVTEVFKKNDLSVMEKYLQTYAQHARQQADLAGNILLINHDRKEAEVISDFFRNTKIRFVHFTHAQEAAHMARAAEFDLVITNLIFDGTITGMTLVREIREINKTMNRVPIMAIISNANPSQKIELLRAGANDIIQRPILLEELSIRLKNLLQTKKLIDTVEFQKQQLQEMAFHDPLTRLYNRHYLVTIVDRIFHEASRYRYTISLLMVDLDFFKKVNDTYGHAIGDIVLQDIAKLLQNNFRGSDIAIRYGGEEFLVLLPHCSKEEGMERAHVLRKTIENQHAGSIRVTASIGVSCTNLEKKITFKALFDAADQAVYEAKNNGRNTVVFHEPNIDSRY